MSIKSRILAAAATLTMVGGLGAAGVIASAGTASAETPSCGFTCVDIFSQQFGHHKHPGFLLDVQGQQAKTGQHIILYRVSNSDLAEDFRLEFQGSVADFYAGGQVSAAFALHYGCIATVNFPDCYGITTVPSTSPFCYQPSKVGKVCAIELNDPAFEIEYTPNGHDSGFCVGVAVAAYQGEGVTLQPCGASSKTVWAVDLFDQPVQSFFLGYAPLINGSDTNFSQPYVLTYPSSGFPTDHPRPQLQVDNLSGYTTGWPPIINYPSIDNDQMWGADFGTI